MKLVAYEAGTVKCDQVVVMSGLCWDIGYREESFRVREREREREREISSSSLMESFLKSVNMSSLLRLLSALCIRQKHANKGGGDRTVMISLL
jgi:hypothetical protein